MTRQDTPRRPRSAASAKPTGPAPTTRIGISAAVRGAILADSWVDGRRYLRSAGRGRHIHAFGLGNKGARSRRPGDPQRVGALRCQREKKSPRRRGGARLTAWRFPKEGRPLFTQNLLSNA